MFYSLEVTDCPIRVHAEASDRMDLLSLNFVALELREPAKEDPDVESMDEEIVEERIEEIFKSTEGVLDKSSATSARKRSRRKIGLDYENFDRRSNDENLPVISLDELAWHDSAIDCWVAIYDYVYDCTEFLRNHPGGQDVILEYAGRDATLAFIGSGHSIGARKILEKYLVGELPDHERIFRKIGGVKIVEQ